MGHLVIAIVLKYQEAKSDPVMTPLGMLMT